MSNLRQIKSTINQAIQIGIKVEPHILYPVPRRIIYNGVSDKYTFENKWNKMDSAIIYGETLDQYIIKVFLSKFTYWHGSRTKDKAELIITGIHKSRLIDFEVHQLKLF